MNQFISEFARLRWPGDSSLEHRARVLQIQGMLYFPFLVEFSETGGSLEDKILQKAVLEAHLDAMSAEQKELTIQIAMEQPAVYLDALRAVLEPVGFAA